jgi:hypothetical protein
MISNETVFVPTFMNISQLVYEELGGQTHKIVTDKMMTKSFALHTSYPKDIINDYEFNFTVSSHSRKTKLV